MTYTVSAVDEAISLLLLIAESPGLGVTEIARRSGNTKARVFRLLTTLEQRGFVRRQGERATYQLSYSALRIGAAAHAQIDLLHIVREQLDKLGSKFDETVLVRVRDGLETLCIARRESTQAVRVHGEIGHRRPLHSGASGKLLLAFAPDDVCSSVIEALGQQNPSRAPGLAKRLNQDIAQIRQQGWSRTSAELAPDVSAISVPIRDGSDEVVAALTVSAPSGRLPDDRATKVLQELLSSAGDISQSLGHAR